MNKDKFENINEDEFKSHLINVDLVKNLIADQFPEYARLTISSVEKQGHDNRTFRLGDDMLVRIPSAKYYASEMVSKVADRSLQIMGGAGYLEDNVITRFYRDTRLFRLYEGTSQIQQRNIARKIIKEI